MIPNLPTAAACDIAGLDRQRFNEDVAKGIYTCAPAAHRVTGRTFDEADICGLYIYGFFQRVYGAGDGADQSGNRKPALHKKVAAMYACQVVQAIREGLPEGTARLDFPLTGFNDECVPMASDAAPAFFTPETQSGAGSNVATLCFTLDGIHEEIRLRYAKWAGEEGK